MLPLNGGGDDVRDARQFLSALACRSGSNPGEKGGLSMWGKVGNYSDGRAFVEALQAFWLELLRGPAGPHRHEHVVVFDEYEQRQEARAFEISLDDDDRLTVREHTLPFSWNQW